MLFYILGLILFFFQRYDHNSDVIKVASVHGENNKVNRSRLIENYFLSEIDGVKK